MPREVGVPATVEKSAGPGQGDERGGAEVRDSPGEEDPRRGAPGRKTGIDPRVVNGHRHHDRAAHQVDRRDPRAGHGGRAYLRASCTSAASVPSFMNTFFRTASRPT